MMKKVLVILLTVLLVAAMFAGCAKPAEVVVEKPAPVEKPEPAPAEEPTEEYDDWCNYRDGIRDDLKIKKKKNYIKNPRRIDKS